jgi:hypothetical protein
MFIVSSVHEQYVAKRASVDFFQPMEPAATDRLTNIMIKHRKPMIFLPKQNPGLSVGWEGAR